MEIKPYSDKSGTKKDQVRVMFDRIAGDYDFLNHLLSFNIDRVWRRKLRKKVLRFIQGSVHPEDHVTEVLDVATGTGDVAFKLFDIRKTKITGIDISVEMIKTARLKAKKKAADIEFLVGDSENLPFPDQSFHVITVAFGVRNFGDLQKGLDEFYRVLIPGGKVFIMEFSKPDKNLFGWLYRLYSKYILPGIASVFTSDPGAYKYLPDSIDAFPHGNEMLERMMNSGFSQLNLKKLSGGIATIYEGTRAE